MSPYKTTRDIFTRHEQTVKILLENRVTHIFRTENPRRIAYQLREAIHVAGLHDDLEAYAALRDLYSFELHPGFVRARWRGEVEITKVEIQADSVEADRSGGKELSNDELEVEGKPFKDKLDVARLPNLFTLSGVIEGVKRFGPRVLEVYCPDAKLTEDELARLFRWAKEKGWTLIDNEDAGLTLTHKDVPEELRWIPKEKTDHLQEND